MTKKILSVALAIAAGAAWTVVPAFADDTAGNKTDRAVDTVKEKGSEAKDKAAETGSKIKDKAVEIKDKIKAKVQKGGSDDVRNAQQALKDKGFDPGPVDGKMGPRTSAALRDFQQKENLKVTGRLDSDTKARLTAAASTTTPPSASPATSPSPAPATTAPSKTPATK